MPTTNDRQPGRRLHMFNCTFCRRDKKKCNPEHRTWPQKCTRCLEKGLSCSQPARKTRERAPNRRETDERAQDEPLVPGIQHPLSSTRPGDWTWDYADLGNALGLLQLLAAEYVEQQAAHHAAKSQLPKLLLDPYHSLPARLHQLGSLCSTLQSTLQSEVTSRLQTKEDAAARLLLETAICTIADPLSGIWMHSITTQLHTGPSKLQWFHSTQLGDPLQEQAERFSKDGQLCLGIVYLSKSMAHSQKQPDVNIARAIQCHDLPAFMSDVTRKFGRDMHSDMWKWPSMIFPNLRPISGQQAIETVLIKNWVGFDNALSLLGHPMLRGASPSDWKNVFRWMCRNPREATRRDTDGRTGLHIAVLLGMATEADMLLKLPTSHPSQQDSAQRTALHLAAILGNEPICDALLCCPRVANSLLLEDYSGRLPVWYAAEGKKEGLFRKLLAATQVYKTMADICTHRDNRGDTLVQYAMAHGLDFPELAGWWDFTPAVEHFYPEREENTLGDGPGGDFQFSNDSLSPWISSQSQLWQPVQLGAS